MDLIISTAPHLSLMLLISPRNRVDGCLFLACVFCRWRISYGSILDDVTAGMYYVAPLSPLIVDTPPLKSFALVQSAHCLRDNRTAD